MFLFALSIFNQIKFSIQLAQPLSHCPKLKMNDKKPSRFQFHFLGLLEACLMLNQKLNEKKSANLDFRDNSISNPDGQDRAV